MKLFQWILTVLGGLYGLIFLIGGNFFPFLIVVLSVVLVAPPLQPQIERRLPWLRFGFLKLFLCIILWLVALTSGGGNTVRFSDVAVCVKPANDLCEQHDIAFLEQTQQLALSAKLYQADTAKQVKVILAYWPEPKQESEVFSQTFDVPKGKGQILLQLEGLNLQPGNYRVSLTPEGTGQKKALSTNRKFSVWTDPEDVKKRNEGEVDNAGFNNSVSKVKICEGNEGVEDSCKDDLSTLSAQVKSLDFTAEIPSFKVRTVRTRGDSEITFLLRYLGKSPDDRIKPMLIFRETQELDRTVGTYTLRVAAPNGGFSPGEFELITSLETRSSEPIRKQFTLN